MHPRADARHITRQDVFDIAEELDDAIKRQRDLARRAHSSSTLEVDTTGWMSYDGHVHSSGSPDSTELQPDRARTAALRAGLRALGMEPGAYEWSGGQPLYFGEPTQDWFDARGITLIVQSAN